MIATKPVPERSVEPNECPNCGALVETPYCPMCGQENEPLRMGIADILRDAAEEFIKWDSKLIHTLTPLLRRPGHLTLEWSRGRRNRYISPFRLYLATAFLFFLVAAVVVKPTPKLPPEVPRKPSVADAELAHRAGLWRFPKAEAFVDYQFAKLRGGSNKAEVMIEKMPQVMFVLLPLFAAALKVFFARSRRYYTEHLVFALHTHAFTYLAFTVVAPVPGGRLWVALAAVASAVYGMLALRRVYGQGWAVTIVKGLTLGALYLVLIVLAAFCTLLVAAMSMPDVRVSA